MRAILKSEVETPSLGLLRNTLAPFAHVKVEGIFGEPYYFGKVHDMPEYLNNYTVTSILARASFTSPYLDILIAQRMEDLEDGH